MRTMFDSTRTLDIPQDATLAAGYVDGRWPTIHGYTDSQGVPQPPLGQRCPKARLVTITVFGAPAAHVCDCEWGDLTEAQAAAWARHELDAGRHPTIYCSVARWGAVISALHAENVDTSRVLFWIAHYDGVVEIPPGAVAKQYQSDTATDLDYSAVADFWPGVDPAPATFPPAPVTPNPVNGVPLTMTADEKAYFDAQFAELRQLVTVTNTGSPGHADTLSARLVALEEKAGITPAPEGR